MQPAHTAVRYPNISQGFEGLSPEAFMPDGFFSMSDPGPSSFKVFIACLHGKTTESLVKNHFSQFCPISDIKLKKNRQGDCKGFGSFVVKSYEDFCEIIDQDHFLLGRKIVCREFFLGNKKQAFIQDLDQRRIFVRNVPLTYTDEDIQFLFSRFGAV